MLQQGNCYTGHCSGHITSTLESRFSGMQRSYRLHWTWNWSASRNWNAKCVVFGLQRKEGADHLGNGRVTLAALFGIARYESRHVTPFCFYCLATSSCVIWVRNKMHLFFPFFCMLSLLYYFAGKVYRPAVTRQECSTLITIVLELTQWFWKQSCAKINTCRADAAAFDSLTLTCTRHIVDCFFTTCVFLKFLAVHKFAPIKFCSQGLVGGRVGASLTQSKRLGKLRWPQKGGYVGHTQTVHRRLSCVHSFLWPSKFAQFFT